MRITAIAAALAAADAARSQAWAATVAAACRDHPERPLPDAARDALAE